MAKVGVIIPVRAITEDDVLWLGHAVESLKQQNMKDWECVIVNDNSTASFNPIRKALQDGRVSAIKTPEEQEGVSGTRNAGLAKITAPLLFPLDHDDILPSYTFQLAIDTLNEQSKCRLVYGDIELLTGDSSRVVEAPPFSLNLLRQSMFLPVGSMHYTEDARKIGGWSPEMNMGLEDWEYWLRLCESGVCGHRVDKIMYTYRRHAQGRLAFLRTHPQNFHAAQTKMRALHADYYSGAKEDPMCVGCGGGRTRGQQRVLPQAFAAASRAMNMPDGQMPQILYVGARQGEFRMRSPHSGTQYVVPGKNQRVRAVNSNKAGVHPNDVRFFAGYDRGQAFRLVHD